mmetsp:Transcript_13784/g.39276  ORF Transcript_13784/g.39276 Transcript_13784/m.39276 type:complete len:667 (-) Transcript_13784:125-2125(-)|eukprot:CAMPEP_0119557346 /NCGR_PEP_ID=MMETSP1352-20130426/9039_1 /TAXON_ID=265584 /ORGANISM="Stauroneis constricta, Strain CCMP1120" /LENGTH=666 /DNA_ID=CAMNT_0007604441 /DNA_START=404 /DNA_END=2404 /DNA_ORIENTATION=+
MTKPKIKSFRRTKDFPRMPAEWGITESEQTGDGEAYRYRDFAQLPEAEVEISEEEDKEAQELKEALVESALLAAEHHKKECIMPAQPMMRASLSVRAQRFPVKLYAILAQSELNEIISWMPHGRAWKVHNPGVFESFVLPVFFDSDNYHSFNRVINAWSFRRISGGPDRGAYFHELFLRGKPHLQRYMRRLPKTTRKAVMQKEDEPDFFALEHISPLPTLAEADIDEERKRKERAATRAIEQKKEEQKRREEYLKAKIEAQNRMNRANASKRGRGGGGGDNNVTANSSSGGGLPQQSSHLEGAQNANQPSGVNEMQSQGNFGGVTAPASAAANTSTLHLDQVTSAASATKLPRGMMNHMMHHAPQSALQAPAGIGATTNPVPSSISAHASQQPPHPSSTPAPASSLYTRPDFAAEHAAVQAELYRRNQMMAMTATVPPGYTVLADPYNRTAAEVHAMRSNAAVSAATLGGSPHHLAYPQQHAVATSNAPGVMPQQASVLDANAAANMAAMRYQYPVSAAGAAMAAANPHSPFMAAGHQPVYLPPGTVPIVFQSAPMYYPSGAVAHQHAAATQFVPQYATTAAATATATATATAAGAPPTQTAPGQVHPGLTPSQQAATAGGMGTSIAGGAAVRYQSLPAPDMSRYAANPGTAASAYYPTLHRGPMS